MDYLILENEQDLMPLMAEYLDSKSLQGKFEILYNAAIENIDVILDAFSTNNVLIIQPTMVTYSQYNLMLMCMYDLLTKDKLGIKEIHIIHQHQGIEDDLREIWQGKRFYLDIILKHIKVFMISTGIDSNIEGTIFWKEQVFL